jgi:hypothetical protein
VIGIPFPQDLSLFVNREKLIPSAAPHIVIRCVDGVKLGRNTRVIPQDVNPGGLVRDLPDLATRLGHDLQA